jgi:tetratricopeptide (TPR) repeat protein
LFGDEKSSSAKPGKPAKKYNPLETARELALAKLADLLFDIGDDEADTRVDSSRQTGSLLKKAIDPFRNARDSKSQIIAYLGQAIDLHSKGDANGAAAYYEKAQRTGMEHGALYLSLGGIYFDTERYEEAIKQFQPATSHLDYAAGAHFGLGLSYGRDGDMKNAISHLLDCLRLVDMTTVPARQADALSGLYENFHESLGRNENEEELVKIGESLVAFLSGEDWQQRVQQARQQLNAQQEGGAITPLADILSMPGAEHAMESLSLIDKYLAKRWYDTAMDEAHRAVEHAPTYLPLHIKMGEILLTMNQTEAAVEKYTAIAEVYQVRGEPVRAGKMYEQVVRLMPMDLEKRTKLINLLNAQGRTEDAIHHYMEMADAHQDLADLDKARQTYAEALRLAGSPGVDRKLAIQILHHIGDIDVQKLDFRTALRTYEQLKGLNPADENARFQIINLHFRLGQIRQAIAETDDLIRFYLGNNALSKIVVLLEGLVQEYPDDLGLRARMARIYQEAGRTGDAVSQYDVLLEAHVQSGRNAEAIQVAQAIIGLDPPDVEHYKQLLARLQSPK